MSSNLGRVVVGVGVVVGWQRGGVAGWWEGKKRRSTMSLVNLDSVVLLDVERMCVYYTGVCLRVWVGVRVCVGGCV